MSYILFNLILAPILFSKWIWFILFSKIVSVIFDSPSAIVIKAVNGACKSVGNPRKGAVSISTAFISLPLIVILLPLSWSLLVTASRWVGITGEIVMEEEVAAAAIRKVPASILSGIT